MKQRTLYQCEVCGTEYSISDAALWCEGLPALPPCPVSPGDVVECYVYGDAPAKDKVVSVHVGPFATNAVEGWIEAGKFAEFVERNSGPQPFFHEWRVTVQNEHYQFDDPYTYTSEFPLSHLWLPGEKNSIGGGLSR